MNPSSLSTGPAVRVRVSGISTPEDNGWSSWTSWVDEFGVALEGKTERIHADSLQLLYERGTTRATVDEHNERLRTTKTGNATGKYFNFKYWLGHRKS